MGNPKNGGYDALTQGKLYEMLQDLQYIKTTYITKKDTENIGTLDFSKKRFRRSIQPIALMEIEKQLDEAKKDAPKNALNALDPLNWISWYEKWFGDDEP